MRIGLHARIIITLTASLVSAALLWALASTLGEIEQQQTGSIAAAYEVALEADALARDVQGAVAQELAVIVADDVQSARAKSIRLQEDLREVARRRSALLAKIGAGMTDFDKIQLSLRIDEFIAYQADTARLCLQVSPKAAMIQANDEATVANREKMLADVYRLSRQMLASVGTTRAAAEGARRLRVFMLKTVPAAVIIIGGLVAVALLRRRRARQQKKRYDVALNNMPQGICMSDRNGVVTVANRRLGQMFDLGAEPSGLTVRRLAERIAAASRLTGDENIAFVENLSSHFSAQDSTVFTAALGERIFEIRCDGMDEGERLIVIDDVTAARRDARKIERLAMFDALTGLPNRAQFNDRLAALIRKCGERGAAFSILSIDLDAFKTVNDTLGHPAGDKLLRAVAERLGGAVREDDLVARFGGDEFVILLAPGAEPRDINAVCERLIARVSAPYEIDGHAVVIGASVGAASFPRDAVTAEALVKSSDLALYHAKALGRRCFRRFDLAMQEEANRKRQIETDLRSAIANDELELFYQPIVDSRTRCANTFEALLRWRHPAHGLISPSHFIPIAEDTGLIVEIGEWALKRACRDAASWPAHIRVAVNFSPVQFRRGNVPAAVTRALMKAGLRPDRLEVEVTEAILIRDVDATLAVFRQLADMGVRLSLDDFGTGYSSLSYISRFPFHKIKIDRAFVEDLTDPTSLAIISAVRHLAENINLSLVVEGVETDEQLAVLSARGVHNIQGFLFSPPRPHAEIDEMTAGPIGDSSRRAA
jgi:diguanylate cyclase (GGDEF)-like protein